jgi:hypothetical protein
VRTIQSCQPLPRTKPAFRRSIGVKAGRRPSAPGRIHHATGHRHDALNHHRTALHLATNLNQPADQDRADEDSPTPTTFKATLTKPATIGTALNLLTNISTDHTEEADVTTTTIRTHLHNLGNSSISA